MEAGDWQLDGTTLAAAAAVARTRHVEKDLSGSMADILRFVNERTTGVRANEAAEKFGDSAYQYLKRLHEMGRIDKVSRGMYVPLPSEPSEQQIRYAAESDSADPEVSETLGPATLPLVSDASDTHDSGRPPDDRRGRVNPDGGRAS
jgi:hypothetical protein